MTRIHLIDREAISDYVATKIIALRKEISSTSNYLMACRSTRIKTVTIVTNLALINTFPCLLQICLVAVAVAAYSILHLLALRILLPITSS